MSKEEVEVKLVPKNCLRKDASLSSEKIANYDGPMNHTPFDNDHKRISGKTHTTVRYFIKKYMNLSALQIIDRLKKAYPLVSKYFMPELRKVHDISIRERKQADPEGFAAATKDAGMSA